MEPPRRMQPKGLADYLDVMSKSVLQTGISWRVVNSKWPGIQEAFQGFDPAVVAAFTIEDIDRLVQDTRIIRNRRKVEAIISNANHMLELDRAHGGFRRYLRSHADFEALVKDLRKQFKFLGDMGAYHFLWVVSEEVPSYEEWSQRGAR